MRMQSWGAFCANKWETSKAAKGTKKAEALEIFVYPNYETES
jgi:hypothetical protein